MNQSMRFILVLFVLGVIGVWQHVIPLVASQPQSGGQSNSTKVSFSYERTEQTQEPIWTKSYQDAQSGSLYFHSDQNDGYQISPLLSTVFDIDVTGMVIRAKVQQTFVNQSDQWVNGLYVFPLPENAAVDHMTMQIGQRTIEGQIHPKQKAKAIFETAKREGKKASLVAQQRPNLFTNSVANIGPGESIVVTIEFQQSVQFDDGQFHLRLPTAVTPRYQPQDMASSTSVPSDGWLFAQPQYFAPPSALGEASADSLEEQGDASSGSLAIEVNIAAGMTLESIDSPSHAIRTENLSDQSYRVSLRNRAITDRDFVLIWQPKAEQSPRAAHFSQSDETGEFGLLMILPPDPDASVDPLPKDTIYILDTSGSMQGQSMSQAILALSTAIESLSPQDRFNVIEFDSSARRLWRQVKTADAANKDEAIAFVKSVEADGGTEMLGALQMALSEQDSSNEERVRQVIFITDGAVGNEAQLFEYIRNNLQQSRLFTIGIGSAPNSYFMTEAARTGRGTYTYIGNVDEVQTKMQALFNKLERPVLADLLVRFNNKVEYYPKQIPDLYSSEPLVISYKAQQPLNSVQVSGKLKHQYWDQHLALTGSAKATGLDVLWARNKIAELERIKRQGADPLEIDQQIEAVAMTHHLVSSQTSLVAVDITPTAQAISQDTMVKSPTPAGQHQAGVLPQTATFASLYFWLGGLFIGVAACLLLIQRR